MHKHQQVSNVKSNEKDLAFLWKDTLRRLLRYRILAKNTEPLLNNFVLSSLPTRFVPRNATPLDDNSGTSVMIQLKK